MKFNEFIQASSLVFLFLPSCVFAADISQNAGASNQSIAVANVNSAKNRADDIQLKLTPADENDPEIPYGIAPNDIGQKQTSDDAVKKVVIKEPVKSNIELQQSNQVKQVQDGQSVLFAGRSTDKFGNTAFENMTAQSMPMTPDQIIKLKKMLSETQRAAASSADVPPKPVLSTQFVGLSPGSVPPVIRLSQGFVTAVVFVDETGAEWPIASYDIGNSQAFNIQWPANSNMLLVQAVSAYTYGNLAVQLQGLQTPVMLTLVPGQQVVDYRADLHVQGVGPKANPTPTNSLFSSSSNAVLLSILQGVAPPGAKRLTIKNGGASAWLYGDKLYLRVKESVLSPGWIESMRSADGTNAYVMVKTPVVLVSRNGSPVELRVEGL
jgi:intracellular multiplication protein IcmK